MGYETLWPREMCVGQTVQSDSQWIGKKIQSVKQSTSQLTTGNECIVYSIVN